MIKPNEVKNKAILLEDENYQFRSFLKNRADEKKLDAQFLSLHNELFGNYDCTKCRNCCKEYAPTLPENEIVAVALHFNMQKEDFINQFMEFKNGEHYVKGSPCRFLNEDNSCQIEDCKPQCCKDYPHTNKPERLWSLLGIVNSASVCPVVFEMLERLKVQYNFKRK